jgi:hypothetical protein
MPSRSRAQISSKNLLPLTGCVVHTKCGRTCLNGVKPRGVSYASAGELSVQPKQVKGIKNRLAPAEEEHCPIQDLGAVGIRRFPPFIWDQGPSLPHLLESACGGISAVVAVHRQGPRYRRAVTEHSEHRITVLCARSCPPGSNMFLRMKQPTWWHTT